MFCFIGAFTPAIDYFRANGFLLSPPKKALKTNIAAPGLYMFGEHDGHFVFDHLRTAQNYIKNLEVRMIKGASHFAQQDDPERVNSFISEFLKEKQPATPPPPVSIQCTSTSTVNNLSLITLIINKLKTVVLNCINKLKT